MLPARLRCAQGIVALCLLDQSPRDFLSEGRGMVSQDGVVFPAADGARSSIFQSVAGRYRRAAEPRSSFRQTDNSAGSRCA